MTASAEGREAVEIPSLVLLDALASRGFATEDGLNYTAARGVIAAADLVDLEINSSVTAGIRLSIDIETGTWRAEVRGQPGGGYSVTDNGLASEVFAEPELSEVDRAVSGTDVGSLLRLCREMQAEVVAEYEHDADSSGYHWFRSRTDFLALTDSRTRLRAVDRLLTGPRVVVVGDLGDTTVETSRLVISGERTTIGEIPPMAKPQALVPLPQAAECDITHSLRRVAFEAAWAEMATELQWRPGDVPVARFEGARTVEFELSIEPTREQVVEAFALWSWATATEEIDRRESVQQAAALAILHPSDVAGAARRALPTARSIYNLARRGVVAEALAARRAARDAAFAAARSAADAATEAATKARDRMLVQVVGGVGVAVGRATDVLSSSEARLLLGVLALVVVGLVVIALAVDLPAARDRLDSFLEDIDEYSEAIDTTSLDAIKAMKSIAVARADLVRSRRSVLIAGGAVALATAGASVAIG